MFVEERRKDIFNYLRKHGKATVLFLAQRYGVTKETIRSDLKLLEENSLIKRCHGGAILAEQSIKPVSWQSMGFNISDLMQELVNKNRDFLFKDSNHPASGKVCVLGSFMIDIVAVIEHFPKEGELLMAQENRFGPGGKGANQAMAASRSGAQVHFIGKVGCDPFGQYAYDHLTTSGIDSFTLYQSSKEPTGSAIIYLSQQSHSNLTTSYHGANTTITPEEIDAILLYLSDADVLLVQGEINYEALIKAVKYARSLGTKIIFNPAPYSAEAENLREFVDYITPNRVEAQKWSGIEISDIDSAKRAAAIIAGKEGKTVLITLGQRGVLVFDGKNYHHIPAYPALTVDTMGAGDAFNGAFAAALSKGDSFIEAARYGCAYSAAFIEYEGGNQYAKLSGGQKQNDTVRHGENPPTPYVNNNYQGNEVGVFLKRQITKEDIMKSLSAKIIVLAAMLFSSSVFAAWPEKPITIIVPWGAGGNTDTVARLVAQGLQKELGVNVNVVNRTGGSGVVGHDAIKRAKADGYTLGIVTVEIAMMHHQNMTTLSYQDYAPISRLAVIYGGLQVSKDAPYADVNALLDFIKNNPGKLKASGSGLNSIWHLNMIGMLKSAGLPSDSVKFIPSQGANAALQELVSGGIDFITSSPGEAKSMVSANMVRHLAIMSPDKSPLYSDVAVYKQVSGHDWTLTAWNLLAAPKDLDPAIQEKLIAAMQKVYESGELSKFANNQGFEVSALYGDEMYAFMAQEDKKFGEILTSQ